MERRSQILDAAGRLLCQRGPGKTTMADIARAAGVAVGSVYLEFNGKADILGALSEARYQRVLAAMRAAAAETPPAGRVRAVLRARLEAFLSLGEEGAFAPGLMSCYCKAVESAWSRFQADQRAVVTAALADGISAGVFSATDADMADVLLRACATLAPPVLCGDDDTIREDAARLFDLLMDGLSARA